MVSIAVKALGFLLMISGVILAFTLIGTLILVAAFEPFFSSNFTSIVASNTNGSVSVNIGLIVALGGGAFLLYCASLFLFMNGGRANPHEAVSENREP